MARPKAFNEEDAIDKAVKVFWAKGYEATSMQDLINAMGIQRGSLYATFGSKQQLFLKSLKRYGVVVVNKLLEILESKPSAIESIKLFFSQLVEHLLTAGELRSCLVTNSAIERGLRDEETKQQVLHLLNALEKGFYNTLLRANKNGELSTELDLKIVANYLTSSMQGLVVIGKVCSERSVLEGINQVTLSVLK
ncbi:MAG: TetR/AcrR family transcriptional regulator [Methylococcaceae bacterium]